MKDLELMRLVRETELRLIEQYGHDMWGRKTTLDKEIEILVRFMRGKVIYAIEKLQAVERTPAAIIPYPGGMIAFGSRDAILSMLSNEDSA